jgi:flagellar hook-associated protein 2
MRRKLFPRGREILLNPIQLKPTARVPIGIRGFVRPATTFPSMSTGLQVAGLASNFDWKSFVDQIMEVERTPAKRLEAERGLNSQKVTLLDTLGTRLTSLQTAATALKANALFGKRTATLSNSASTWSAAAGIDTAPGEYRIAVTRLATTASLKGASDMGAALNPAGTDVSGLTIATLPIGQAIAAGTFTVNGKQVTVALTDSLQAVFDKIALATGNTVTAAYSNTTDKITLTSTSGEVMLGAANDTSNFLRALKLGNNGTATTTSTAQLGTVKTGAPLASANLTTAVTAGNGAGDGVFAVNGVAINYNVNTDSLSAIVTRINESSAGVTASYDAVNDRVVLANKSTGDLGVSVSDTLGTFAASLGLTAGTTFARGENATFTLNGGDVLTSTSNTLDGTVHGVAGLSVTAASVETQTVRVAADTGAMRSKITAFVDAFNAVQQFIDTNTKITADGKKGTVKTAPLSGNREIQDWSRSLRTMAFAAVSGLTGSVKRLDDLGLDFKPGTAELVIDDDAKLDAALANATNDVDAFFTTAATGFSAKLGTFLEKISTQNEDQQTGLTKANTSIDDQIAAIERRLVQQRAIMESAFIAMEIAQSRIKQQQSSLDAMIAQSTQK